MCDDEDVGAGERFADEGAIRVGEDLEVAVGEARGGGDVRGVRGVGGLHLLRHFGADRPGLGVELVEEDAGDLRLGERRCSCFRDRHSLTVRGARDGVNS